MRENSESPRNLYRIFFVQHDVYYTFQSNLNLKAMKKIFYLVGLLTLFLNCSQSEQQSDKLLVGASIAPLADFVHQVGGDYVEVFTIVPPGVNPHAFELTPGLMKKLNNVDLFVFNGAGLEFWLDNVLDNLKGKKATFTSDGLEIHEDIHHDHDSGNPHVWLNPQNAIHQVKKVYYALADVDPAHKSNYESNAALYIRHLEIVDQDIQQTVDTWEQKKFVCFHPAWDYFAERYGLEMAGVIEKRPGMEPSPRDIADIINTVHNIGAKAIFVEAQFPSRVADMIADESDIRVVALDPIGGSNGLKTYVELMRYNVVQMTEVMKD